jgi:hypothetical protein
VPFDDVPLLLSQLDRRLTRERELAEALTEHQPLIRGVARMHATRKAPKPYTNYQRFPAILG